MDNNMERIRCPYCGYRMPVAYRPGAVASGLYLKCKNKRCGKNFEIKLPREKKGSA